MQKQDTRAKSMDSQCAIILLGAGLSSRLNGEQKIVKTYKGETLLFYSLKACLNAFDTILVVGHQKDLVIADAERILQNNTFPHKLTIVQNENYKDGQYSSIQAGIRALKDMNQTEPFAIMTGDVPFVKSSDFITLFDKLGDSDVIRPFVNGVPCHPVILNTKMMDFILSHSDVTNVRDLLQKYKGILRINSYPYTQNDKLTNDFDVKENFETEF